MSTQKNYHIMEFLPIIGSFLIFLGMIRLTYYYSSFGINIINFLNLTEIITSFFDVIIKFAFQFVFATIFALIVYTKKELEERNSTYHEILKESSFVRRLFRYLIHFRIILNIVFYVIVPFLVFLIIDYSFEIHVFEEVLLLIFVSGSLLILRAEIEHKYGEDTSKSEFSPFVTISIFGVFLVILVMLHTHQDVQEVINHHRTIGVSIELDDGITLISDSTNFYIGKTENFVFFYYKTQNRTEVIPVGRVKEMTFNSPISE